MHTIEPYYNWRAYYLAENDNKSPFYGRQYSEFSFRNKVYNYYIHPQWDHFGSDTLYAKILFVDYQEGYAIIELIGEWNDCLYEDIQALKQNIIDELIQNEIYRYILCCDNVLNFHGSDNCYYEEWYNEIIDEGGWIMLLDTLKHVEDEMRCAQIHHYALLGPSYNQLHWRNQKPEDLYHWADMAVTKYLSEA